MLVIWIFSYFIGLVCFIYASIRYSGANRLLFNLIKTITSVSSGSSVLDFTNVDRFVEMFYRIFESFKRIRFILS